MASGKTYFGKRWAETADVPFFDLDTSIEKAVNSTISDIFKNEGEAGFRKVESDMLHALSPVQKAIISCGGGTACFNNNMDWMNNNGITIYLQASSDTIFRNIQQDETERPLIKGKNAEELTAYIDKQWGERSYYYQKATYTIPVQEDVIEALMKIYHLHA